MKKVFIISSLALCLWGLSATPANAQFSWSGGLVKCGNNDTAGPAGPGGTPNVSPAATQCDFTALVALINTLIQYLIFIAMPLAAISFAYAGWLYLSAGDDPGKVKKARTIFTDVAIGFVLVLSAWLIFNTIAKTFLSSTYQNSTFLKQ